MDSIYFQTEDFARFAFRHHFKRTATDFAIRRETLAGHARIHGQFKRLAAERTRNRGVGFHPQNLTAIPRSAIVWRHHLLTAHRS
jgi:hypothetical protein